MKNKKIIVISVILIILLIGLGIYFCIKKMDSSVVEPNISTEKEETNQEIQEVETSHNQNDANYNEHCLEGFCTIIMDFSYREGYGGFSLTILNKTNSVIEKGFKNIVFSTPNGEVKKYFYYDTLEVDAIVTTEITFTDESIMNATDYEIVEPTLEELMEYYSNMSN